MTIKILFTQFKESLRSRTISPELVSSYIEWDDDSAEQKLKFKSDTFLDEVPDSYDLDEEIYQYLRDLDDSQEAEFEELSFKKRPRVVAEGDSWYNLPFFIRPFAIADWMKEHKRLKVKNIARWGHTLAEILEQDEYISAIERYKPQHFMICGGGNDIKNSLAKGNLFHSYSADRRVDNYLTDEGFALIEYIGDGLLSIMKNVQSKNPDLPIYVHGYDYPRPWVGKGKYIGRYLRQLSIPREIWEELMRSKIDLLNTKVEEAANKVSTATYIDCRNVTKDYRWRDDLHPTAPGFRVLALKFEAAMGITLDS